MKSTFKARLWVYPGDKASWRFITVPKDISGKIRKSNKPRGWGSHQVRVTIGKTSWDTSIFWESKSLTFLLPVKATIRRAEGIEDGETVSVKLVIR